ncbi:MAG: glycerol-3-phosphate acyltransferase [Atopobiaceae bacterium]|nr:glycerol-3-phosphate acyltransferase [Atopobiaceae bacterium]
MAARLICALVGYLFGCILTAEIVARIMAKRSIFEVGDGNPGMANVGYELGTKAALACLAGDILKTLIPVLIMSRVCPQLSWPISTAWTGLGATLGHMFPFWHHFKGGKGVTTIASTVILMNPVLGALTTLVAGITLVLTGYLCITAVVAMGFYALVACFTMPTDCMVVSLVFFALELKAHWSKIQGIHDGTTHRAGVSIKFWKALKRQ